MRFYALLLGGRGGVFFVGLGGSSVVINRFSLDLCPILQPEATRDSCLPSFPSCVCHTYRCRVACIASHTTQRAFNPPYLKPFPPHQHNTSSIPFHPYPTTPMAGMRIVNAVRPLIARRTFYNTARIMSSGETGSGFSRAGGERAG
jgi:hypothetical protein